MIKEEQGPASAADEVVGSGIGKGGLRGRSFVGERFWTSCCSRTLCMTPLFNLSTALFGSQRSFASGSAMDMFVRGEETEGVVGDSVAAPCSLTEVVGLGASPSFCFT